MSLLDETIFTVGSPLSGIHTKLTCFVSHLDNTVIHSVEYLSSVEEFLGKKYGPESVCESVCVVGSGART